MSEQTPIAGWYPDPQGSGQQRWWDGNQWTSQFAPAAPGYVSVGPRAGGGSTALIVCGYIFAVLIPLIGLILGIVAWRRPEPATKRQGPWIVLVSVVVAVLVAAVELGKHKHGS